MPDHAIGLPIDLGNGSTIREIEIDGLLLRFERNKTNGVRLRVVSSDGTRVEKQNMRGGRVRLTKAWNTRKAATL